MKIVIENKSLKEIDCSDEFFDSLRSDYYKFDEWFISKQRNNCSCYVTYDNNKISSFLLFKFEYENESYADFDKPFINGFRLKICTFKVEEVGKNIGKSFMKIIDNYANDNNVQEIYVTINPKYVELINFFKQYNFNYYTNKFIKDGKGNIREENIFVKKIRSN